MNMRELRESLGLTITQVGAATGVSASTVRDWEAGKYEPRYTNIKELMRLFERSFDEIGEAIEQSMHKGGKK
ncbi:helix-turn-helix transcriptional regulator [Allocoleopsis sp.]|uniref:helix-turn-helix domain-containing protein n=1 Tax=Allocoleopsis sp. TaxID=3088169 RepID=UPI002FCEE526